jgi:propanediol utilization protein
MIEIPVGVSARHCHLSRHDVEGIFGKGYELTAVKLLKQPGQYLCAERISVKGPSGEVLSLGIIGPERSRTQVEISATDARKLGLKNVPVRASGFLKDAPGVLTVDDYPLYECVIVAERHVHLTDATAKDYELKDKGAAGVNVMGKRGYMLLGGVLVRVGNEHADEFHIDCDEAAAFGLSNGDKVTLL